MKRNLVLVCVMIFWMSAVSAQSNSEEIQRLQAQLKQNEQMAKEAEARAVRAEENSKRMRYLAVANELAELSVETQDKELAALQAVLAHNLSVQFGGYIFNGKIYNA